MTSILTAEELAFLNKMEQQREKHKIAQARYRANNKNMLNENNRIYQEKQKLLRNQIKEKLHKAEAPPPPEPIDIEAITRPVKIDKRTREGKKKAQLEIKPAYETRAEPLGYSTISDYIAKYNILNNLFNKRPLPQPVKGEIKKVLNDNDNINKNIIFDEMTFIINDIDNTINIIRQAYTNNNSFKSYINILAVLTSHFKEYNKIYLTYSKIAKSINKEVLGIREENIIGEDEKDKIIPVGETEFLNNVNKLDKPEDVLIYGLYLLFPARRLDYRNMMITTEQDLNKLDKINYLIINGSKYIFIFNDYKTYSTYKQQVFEVPKALNAVISKYLYITQRKAGDYLISLDRNKKEIISEGNFSAKISNIFNKVYNIPISIRFLRMSWASALYSKNPTVKEIKEQTLKMAHSPSESRLYNKLLKA